MYVQAITTGKGPVANWSEHIADPGAVNAWNYATKFTPTLQRTRQTTEKDSPLLRRMARSCARSCAELYRRSTEQYRRSTEQCKAVQSTAGLCTVKYSLVQTSYGSTEEVQSTAGLSTELVQASTAWSVQSSAELQQDLVQFSTG